MFFFEHTIEACNGESSYKIRGGLYTYGEQMPIIQINGKSNGVAIPLDVARRLARKILSIPTPVGFVEREDV